MTNKAFIDEYIFMILYNISDLLAGFLVLYSKCVSKSKKKEKEGRKTQSELIYTKLDKLKKKFYVKLIIVVILNYLSRSSNWLSYAITKTVTEEISRTLQKNIKIALDIIMRYIFSVFILKIVVYKHRIFSMITISIGLSIFIINDILLMFFDNSNNYNISKTFIFTAISLIGGFTYPLEDTFVKKIFTEEYLYPANFLFYRAIAGLILILMITPILYFSFKIKFEFNFANISIVIPTIILCALASFIKNYITLKIIYHYCSQSVSILRISKSFGGSIIRFIDIFRNIITNEWKIIFIILEIISILIVLFASLVYDEIIIINKWELNKNVKLGIINRRELDTADMNIFVDNQLDDNQLIDNESDNNEKFNVNNSNIEDNKVVCDKE